MGTMRLLITLFILAFTQLFFNMAHASPHTPINANQQKADSNTARADERRKRRPVKATSTKKVKAPVSKKAKETVKKEPPKSAQHLSAKKLKEKEKKKPALPLCVMPGLKRKHRTQNLRPAKKSIKNIMAVKVQATRSLTMTTMH